MEFLSNLIIKPLYFILEFLFVNLFSISENIILTIFLISFIVSLACLPLYIRADFLQEEEQEIQKKLSKKVNSIKKNFKGDERLLLLQTYYKQNNYHPIMGLRLSLSLLLQIPIFIAAYTFFTHLEFLQGFSTYLFHNLSKPDELLAIGNFTINLLPIIMTIINIYAGLIYSKGKSFKEHKALILMSLIFLVLLYNSPCGLVLYWTFNNIFSLIKNIYIRKIGIEKIKNFDILKNIKFLNFHFNYKQIFILSLIALWIILGIYIPSSVIATSPLEFIFKNNQLPINIVQYSSIVFAGVIIFWGSCIYYFSSEKLRKFYSLTLFTLMLVSLINIFILKMPPVILSSNFTFEIANINFASFNILLKVVYYLLLISTITFSIKLIKKKKETIIKYLILTIIFSMFSISTYNCTKIVKKTNSHLNKEHNTAKLEDKYIKLSKTKKNVLILFVDRAINSYLQIIFNEHPYLIEQFKGFTYYPYTLSYSGYTLLGYLPILGGYEYTPFEMDKREGIFEKKFNESLTMLPLIFKKNNWETTVINPIGDTWESETWGGVTKEEINILSNDKYYKDNKINHYTIPDSISNKFKEYATKNDYLLSKRNIIYFSLLSIATPNLRNFIYNKGNYFNTKPGSFNDYSAEFIKEYATMFFLKGLTDFSSKENNFVVFNSYLPHYPSLLNYPNYDISRENDENYEDMINFDDNNFSLKHYHVNVATLKLLGEYFDFLRKNNVFDNTKIIVVADHGFGYNIQNPFLREFEEKYFMPYNPLLLVKDFNSNDDIKISYEFMTNADVPTIATNDLIKNPTNPYTKNKIKPNKDNGILIKHDTKWQPIFYLGKQKTLNKKDVFLYVENNPLEQNNWKIDLPYEKALKIYNQKGILK